MYLVFFSDSRILKNKFYLSLYQSDQRLGMIVMIMMMYVLVDVSSAGRGRHCVLREFTFKPTHDLCHRSGLILLPCRVLQLMLLAGSTALLRLDELRIIALHIIVIVDDCLVGRCLLVVGHKIDDITVSIVNGGVMLRRVRVNRRWHVHVTIQHLGIRRIGLGGGMCRVIPRCRVPRLPKIRRPRLGRCFGKCHGMMSVLTNRLVISRSRLTRLRRCLAVLITMIRGFQMGTVRWNARCLFVLMSFSVNKMFRCQLIEDIIFN